MYALKQITKIYHYYANHMYNKEETIILNKEKISFIKNPSKGLQGLSTTLHKMTHAKKNE